MFEDSADGPGRAAAQHHADAPLPLGEQVPQELHWMLGKLRSADCRSVLEIGSRSGKTLRAMALSCGTGARIYAIDIADGGVGEVVKELSAKGYPAELLLADSTSPAALTWARYRAPFDFVFIDGDHTYDGARSDWLNYGGMARFAVGFHDIAHGHWGVRELWQQLQAEYSTVEYVAPGSYYGIGMVPMDGDARAARALAAHRREAMG